MGDRGARRGLRVARSCTAGIALLLVSGSIGARDQPLQDAQHEKHWGYVNGPESVGPAHWGELSGNQACSAGKLQSPIALASAGAGAATPAEGPALTFHYHASKLAMVNNGHTVQVNVDSGSSANEGGATYRLVQFHVHAPSEHTLNGASFPLEIHLVHVDTAGQPALVVGVFVREGKANPALATAFVNLPKTNGATSAPAGASVDPSGILPASLGRFDYDGSLTTPPCSEGIRWRVMREPITMSAAQIEAFRSLPHLGHSARPVQPRDRRAEVLIAAP